MANQGPDTADQSSEKDWTQSIWDCSEPALCMRGLCCPCFLFGTTQSRESGGDHSACSSMCCLWLALAGCGFSSCLQWYKRCKMRDKYGLSSSGCADCLVSFFCPCCALVQEEMQSKIECKKEGGYQKKEEMKYAQ